MSDEFDVEIEYIDNKPPEVTEYDVLEHRVSCLEFEIKEQKQMTKRLIEFMINNLGKQVEFLQKLRDDWFTEM